MRDGIRVIENQSVRDTVAPVVARKNEPTGPSDRIKETWPFAISRRAVATISTIPSSGDPNDDAIRDLDVIERDPGISGASPISRTILIMAFHPDRILRRPPVRQSPCRPGGIARPLKFLGQAIGLLR